MPTMSFAALKSNSWGLLAHDFRRRIFFVLSLDEVPAELGVTGVPPVVLPLVPTDGADAESYETDGVMDGRRGNILGMEKPDPE
jgi:hypothetical protein